MTVHRCSCLERFDGPRCQQTHVSFNGQGWAWYPPLDHWAWYPPLDQCHHAHTSLEMITSRDSGLILYFGPLNDDSDDTREDFLLLELRGGYPVLRVNEGSGEARLAVDGRDRQGRLRVGKLSDGRWHQLDIFINKQAVLAVFCSFHT